MGLTKKDESASAHPMYYKENNTPLRETRFFLKPVQATTAKGRFNLSNPPTRFRPFFKITFYTKWHYNVTNLAFLGEKRHESVNVQVVRGKTTTFIHLDDEEAKKVWLHGDAALKKIQQVHKTAIWDFFVGRASIDGIQKVIGKNVVPFFAM